MAGFIYPTGGGGFTPQIATMVTAETRPYGPTSTHTLRVDGTVTDPTHLVTKTGVYGLAFSKAGIYEITVSATGAGSYVAAAWWTLGASINTGRTKTTIYAPAGAVVPGSLAFTAHLAAGTLLHFPVTNGSSLTRSFQIKSLTIVRLSGT